MIDKKWSEQGFIDEPIPANIDVKTEIKRMCKEKNAVIMAHYYTDAEVQDLALRRKQPLPMPILS